MVTLLLAGPHEAVSGAPEPDPAALGTLRRVVESHGGRIERILENGLYASFPDGAGSLAAVLELQAAPAANDASRPGWRVVVDAEGSGELVPDALFLHASRLLQAVHPGQVLLSHAAGAVLADVIPSGANLRDLGEHRFGSAEAQRVLQLVHPALRFNFPILHWGHGRKDNLPAAASSFVPREAAREAVHRLLRAHRLVTLTGPGGSGKTRLALKAASDLLHEFTDGVWFVDLSRLPPNAGSLVTKEIASVLEVCEEPGKRLPHSLLKALRFRHVLLVLDNCEHVVRGCAPVVADLLQTCPDLRILVTSRERLGVGGEGVFPVPPLSLPPADVADVKSALDEYEAVRLFLERARAVSASFELTLESLPAVVEICRRSDSIPLGIELAAAQTRSLSPEQILARMREPLRLLVGGSRTAAFRQQSLRSAIDWSFLLLPATEQTLLARLSAFAGSFSIDAVEEICAGADLPRQEVHYHLQQLLDKSLVQLAPPSGRPAAARYRLLQVVREYAVECLESEERGRDEARRTRLRHTGYYLALAEAAERRLRGREQEQALAELDAETDNFRAALAFCLDVGDGETALRLSVALGRFWDIRGHFQEGREWLAGALRLVGGADEDTELHADLRAAALNAAGTLARRQSDYPGAQALHAEALSLLRRLGDVAGEAATLVMLGNVAQNEGDYPRARGYYEEARRILSNLDDRAGQAEVAFSVGVIARHEGDYAGARRRFEESLSIRWEGDDREGAAACLAHLGLVAADEGDCRGARTFYQEALRHFRELGHKQGTADALVGLGMVLRELGEYERAREHCEEALVIRRGLRNQRGVAGALSSLGSIAAAVEDYGSAASLQREALEKMREIENPRGVADTLAGLACALRALGDPETARAQWEESLDLRRRLKDRRGLAATLRYLGDLARDLGDLGQAQQFLQESLTLRRDLGNPVELALGLESMACLCAARAWVAPDQAGRLREARAALRLAGGAAALRSAAGAAQAPAHGRELDTHLLPIRELLGPEESAEVELHGRAIPPHHLCEYALHGSLPPS